MYSLFYAFPFYLVTFGMLWVALRRQYPLLPFILILVAGRLGFVIGTWMGGGEHGRSTLFSALFGLVAVVGAVRYLRFQPPILDLYALFLPLALALQRIGCLFAGCCYGTPTEVSWGVRYLSEGPWVHPVPAYLILGYIAVWGILFAVRNRIPFSGGLALLGLGLLSIVRFSSEFFRDADSNQILASTWFGLKHLQWVSLAMTVLFFSLFMFLGKRAPKVIVGDESSPAMPDRLWSIALVEGLVFLGLFPILNRPEWIAMIPLLAGLGMVALVQMPIRSWVRAALVVILGTIAVMAANPAIPRVSFYGIVGANQGEIVFPTESEPTDCGGTYYSKYRSREFTAASLGGRVEYENLRRIRFYTEAEIELLGGAYYTAPENADWRLYGGKGHIQMNIGVIGFGAGVYSVQEPEKSVIPTKHITGHLQLGSYRQAYLRAGILDDSYGTPYIGVGGETWDGRLRFELGITDDGAYDRVSYRVSKRGHILEFRGIAGDKHTRADLASSSELEIKWLMPIGGN